MDLIEPADPGTHVWAGGRQFVRVESVLLTQPGWFPWLDVEVGSFTTWEFIASLGAETHLHIATPDFLQRLVSDLDCAQAELARVQERLLELSGDERA